MRAPAAAALAVLMMVITGSCRAEAPPPGATGAHLSPAGLELVPLAIRSRGATHQFTVELARTDDQQEHGLMFRKRVPPDEGMLFPFDRPHAAIFWMKNTLVPLDMLFIRSDGTIARVAANTTPLSLTPVGVDEPVAAVLELAGGRSAELGISTGDTVRWPGGPRP